MRGGGRLILARPYIPGLAARVRMVFGRFGVWYSALFLTVSPLLHRSLPWLFSRYFIPVLPRASFVGVAAFSFRLTREGIPLHPGFLCLSHLV